MTPTGDDADPARHLPAAVVVRVRLCRSRRARPLSRPARGQPPLPLALPQGAAGQRPWLRPRRSQLCSTRNSAPRPTSWRWSRRSANTASARSSTSCPTTWASAGRTIRSGSTSSNGGRTPATRDGSTSTGSRNPASRRQGAGAVSRRPVRRGALRRPARPPLRRRARQLRRVGLWRPQAAGLALPLRQDPRRRRIRCSRGSAMPSPHLPGAHVFAQPARWN